VQRIEATKSMTPRPSARIGTSTTRSGNCVASVSADGILTSRQGFGWLRDLTHMVLWWVCEMPMRGLEYRCRCQVEFLGVEGRMIVGVSRAEVPANTVVEVHDACERLLACAMCAVLC
jgi:hypothetical protein